MLYGKIGDRRRLKFVAALNGRLHEARARQSESDRAVLA